MRKRVRIVISTLSYYSGLVKLLRWWFQYSGRYLIILYYHQSKGENLRSQWLYLRRHYRILPLDVALEELYTQYKKGLQRKDRRTLLALTFDDGYYDNYTDAFALASELQVPITIFLIPGYIDCNNSFWWADRLIRLAHTDHVSFEEHTYRLDQQEERKALAQIINDRVCKAVSVTDREKLLTAICEVLEVPPSVIANEYPVPLLTWTQVREMKKSEWVSFGAHTIHHADLGRLTNPIEVLREVGECRTMLEQKLEHSIDAFAYPHGNIGNHGLSAVKQSGYKWAFTILPGFNTHQTNPHLLHRMNADADRHLLVAAAETAGVWIFFGRVKRIARLLIRPLYRTSVVLRRSDGSQMEKERIMRTTFSHETPSQDEK
jgi:peptidoglycan/xylan/chitin deacetylase (PgdA/CDA1 family)